MAILKVANMGNPTLRKNAEPVPPDEITKPRIQTLIKDIINTMGEYSGRGLAAPQVHENLQMVAILWDFDADEDPFIQILINPKIKTLTKDTSTFWEGCLSLPGLIGKVSRPNRVMVEALNEEGKSINFIAEDFTATVVQHEVDHLHGILYVDHIEDTKDFSFTSEYNRYLLKPAHPKDE